MECQVQLYLCNPKKKLQEWFKKLRGWPWEVSTSIFFRYDLFYLKCQSDLLTLISNSIWSTDLMLACRWLVWKKRCGFVFLISSTKAFTDSKNLRSVHKKLFTWLDQSQVRIRSVKACRKYSYIITIVWDVIKMRWLRKVGHIAFFQILTLNIIA